MKALLLLIASICVPQEESYAGRSLASLIKDLGAESIDLRMAAETELLRLGKRAVPALKKAAEGGETEMRARASSLIHRILFSIPTLGKPRSTALPDDTYRAMASSRSGKFLLLATDRTVLILEGRTLETLHTFKVAVTAMVFDERDETLTLVGKSLYRYDTKRWVKKFSAELPDGAFSRFGQALFLPGGDIVYRTSSGSLKRALIKDDTLTVERLEMVSAAGWRVDVDQLFSGARDGALKGDHFLLTYKNMDTCFLWHRGRVFGVAAVSHPKMSVHFDKNSLILAGGRIWVLGENYKRTTTHPKVDIAQPDKWRLPPADAISIAALDRRKGIVLYVRHGALHAWSIGRQGLSKELARPKSIPTLLELHSDVRQLFGVSGNRLYRWTLID